MRSPATRHALRVNGRDIEAHVAPETRLADVLRDTLGLTGTKIGCNAGDCGACTVLLDGRQVCACLVPVAQAEGRAVETVEGLAREGRLAPLQRAFLDHGAAQCGICTPGMLMAAADLLARNPYPSEAEVLDGLGGVLCRCTGYRKIVEAVLSVGRNHAAADPAPPAGRAVGARLPKTDGVPKVTGADRFGADALPETAWLTLRAVRSPHAHAAFRIGELAALHTRFPGLVAVLTARDVPGSNRFGIYPTGKDQPVFAEGVARMRGEAVCALVGDAETIAGIRDEDVPIAWEPLPPVTFDAALAGAAQDLHEHAPGNVLCRGRVVAGDAEAALADATHRAAIAVETGFVEHAYIEPEAGYARRVGDRIEIVACTQTPYMDRDELALILGIAPEQVRVIPTATGGGFGGKLDLSLQPMIAVAAWRLGRPVRCVYTRPESMASTTKRHPARITAEAACDAEGRLLAYRFHGDFNTGAYASWGPTVANRVPVHAMGPYRVPNVRATSAAIHTTDTPAGAFRGFGVPQAAIAHEALMDALAGRAGIDRLEFRALNALRKGDATATGQVLDHSVGLLACLDALRPRWQALRAEAEAFNRAAHGPIRRGVGVACMWYGIGNTSMSNPSEMTMGIAADGTITLYSGAVDIGQGSNTIMVQIAADALGVPADAVRLVHGDTDRTRDAGKTSASRQTFVSGNAARLAGEDLRRRLLALVNAGPDATIAPDLTIRDGARVVRPDLARLSPDVNGDVLVGSGRFDPPTTALDADGRGVPYATYGFAAQLAAVEVDIDLGTVRVTRVVAAHDVGRAVNPTQVEGQIHGGVAQGLGLALMEEFFPGRNENLHDYLIPTIGDIPPIETILIEDPEPLGPYGAKGVGEPALIATAPAILGAIAHAAGVRLTRVPATPDRVRAAILAKSA
ncbi:molybdopterin cofactor-binding domain-containing protein [Elioraea tepidiphila]|jgi:CO/xanthine dehydrogenase Mo-binding subunit/aerobic-type carbon monoxide dehydrogenase small subunit (CoxS/CutS family)|uniref:molybdopterin-dependent oxidoreductase n=1 Tax=Elioraea tepidiphila TaxID=457934 RepID=UPI002FD88617